MWRAIEKDQLMFYVMNDTMQIGQWEEVSCRKLYQKQVVGFFITWGRLRRPRWSN
jgi:hypothetical protein